MNLKHILVFLACCMAGCRTNPRHENSTPVTFCNPVNVSYRFCPEEPSRREAADPTVVWFRDRYFLFASKSGGYWHSKNLTGWSFIETNAIPVEEYAPTAVAIGDTLYFLASSNEQSTVYQSADPLNGTWSVAVDRLEIPVWDPAFFLDEDNRLYLYWGCSDVNPIYGVEVDYANRFSFIGEPKALIRADPDRYGWEVPGDRNTLINQRPWIEGAWMNKHNGIYNLQYSAPGTEFKSYADGVYTSENPLGPFMYQSHNPFASKPGGFAAGAGHGSTFTDPHGNHWHMGTITISRKHIFERRLGLYPAFFDAQGTLYAITKYGDYPLMMPQKKIADWNKIFPGWMLLSYAKTVTVSSSVDSHPACHMTNEDIRTYWAARTGDPGEYAIIDLGDAFDVYSIQINFAEHNSGLLGRQENLFHRYTIDCSDDGSNWKRLVDRSKNETDNSHDYIQLTNKVSCRYLKMNNIEVPGGHFALSGFRVFGKGHGDAPERINRFESARNPQDRRSVSLTWGKSETATGYTICYGIEENKLYLQELVYRDTSLVINSLDRDRAYYFSIESFNENGITPGGFTIRVP
ncbi:MAG TPA: carbohydrate-binding protein [bacterium]|nr:carbohydrate-binding protein [bacterium]